MQNKQISSSIQFFADSQTLEILENIESGARDKYINDAVRAYAKSAPFPNKAVVGNTPADRVNAELGRVFGGSCDTIIASAADSNEYVIMMETKSRQQVKCGVQDALDILKSLRQPILAQEVWEIISVLG